MEMRMDGNNRGDPLFIFFPLLSSYPTLWRDVCGWESFVPHAYDLCVGSGSKPTQSPKVEDVVFWLSGLWEGLFGRILVIPMSPAPWPFLGKLFWFAEEQFLDPGTSSSSFISQCSSSYIMSILKTIFRLGRVNQSIYTIHIPVEAWSGTLLACFHVLLNTTHQVISTLVVTTKF